MKEAIGSPTVGKLDMSPDTETFQEVMAFTGPAPEVRNRTVGIRFGRLSSKDWHCSTATAALHTPSKTWCLVVAGQGPSASGETEPGSV